MKDYMKTGFEEYADELNVNLKNNPKKVFRYKPVKLSRNKASLNQIYEMKTHNYSDYSTDTLEKLE